jgi:hypothetical protein
MMMLEWMASFRRLTAHPKCSPHCSPNHLPHLLCIAVLAPQWGTVTG